MGTFVGISSGYVCSKADADSSPTYGWADSVADVSAVTPQPGIGWTFDGTNYAAPAMFQAPPMPTGARNTLVDTAGYIIFNTDLGNLQRNDGGGWADLS